MMLLGEMGIVLSVSRGGDLKSPDKLDGRSDPNIQPSFRILWGIFCEMGAAFMENRIVVTGGRPLNGAVRIPAAKNSVLPLLAASMLCSERVRLRAVPRLSDVAVSLALLRGAGCAARWEGEDVVLSGPPKTGALPGQTAEQMRASILFCAPLLAKLGRAETNLPGGCRIGARPIDLHLAGLRQMGAVEWDAGPGRLVLTAPSGLHGAEITLRFPSVGGDGNAGAGGGVRQGHHRAAGRGAGAGDHRSGGIPEPLRCGHPRRGELDDPDRGAAESEWLHLFRPLPDRIFASTLACAAAAAGGRAELLGCPAGLYAPVLEILEQMGCRVEAGGESVRVSRFGRLYGAGRVFTGVYPALATDAAPLLAAAMLCAEGESSIEDVIFERRGSAAPSVLNALARRCG